MRLLSVMDPLEVLDADWDTTICVLRELVRRGHGCWTADIPDIWWDKDRFKVSARQFPAGKTHELLGQDNFDLVLIRKEPPFNDAYLYLTYLMELAAARTPMSNDPRGIRNANEKLSALNFPAWIPETLITDNPRRILEFQDRLKGKVVLKPVNLKGGKDVTLLDPADPNREAAAAKATQNGKKFIVAQAFVGASSGGIDKRILILNGEILTAYEKHPAPGEFRANLSCGAVSAATELSAAEKKIVEDLSPYLKRNGLHLAGIDVLEEKLIEINVTCPAGLCEAMDLYSDPELVRPWADFLESLAAPSTAARSSLP